MAGIRNGMKKSQAERFADAKGGDANTIKLKEGENVVRVIIGPVAVRQIWYPTFMKNEDDESFVGHRRLQIPPKGSEICKLFNQADKKLAKLNPEMTEKKLEKYRSLWNGGTRYWWLAFDRANAKPVVEVLEVSWTINEKIEKFTEAISKKKGKTDFLRYGLPFMYDLIITKDIDPKIKNKMHATSYEVDVDHETIPVGDIPISWLHEGFEGDLDDYFTEEELKAMDDYKGELEEMTAPLSETEIQDKLTDSPPILNAMRDNKFEMAGLCLLEDDSFEADVYAQLKESLDGITMEFLDDPKDSAPPEKEEEPKALPPGRGKKEAEETDYEEVKDEDDEPPKRSRRIRKEEPSEEVEEPPEKEKPKQTRRAKKEEPPEENDGEPEESPEKEEPKKKKTSLW